MRKFARNQRHYRSPRSEINRLKEAIKRENDKIEREKLYQQLEHWTRTQNNSQ